MIIPQLSLLFSILSGETCGRAYAMRSTLEQHLTSHSKEQPYLCDACGFATKYIAHLMAHKRIHTGDVHRCTFPDCKYSTPKKSQLLSHARTHEGVRPHTCHICGRGFLEKSHLVRPFFQDIMTCIYLCVGCK